MPRDIRDFLLFSGSSHPEMAQEVAGYLGVTLGRTDLSRFPDGEISLQIKENVRGRDVFVLQSVALDPNRYLMELLIMVDSLKRASARSICVVIPYFGYCRQDRKDKPRVPITAKLVANLIVTAGATRLMTMDLHTEQLQGFFDIPVDNLYGRVVLAEKVRHEIGCDNLVVVTPDTGSIRLAREYASDLHVNFAIVDKHRVTPTEVKTIALIGNVEGKNVLLADDICATASTLVSAAKVCQEKGAKRIFAVVTHGLLVSHALKKIEESPIEMLYVSNTISYADRFKEAAKLHVVSVAGLFGKAIQCILSRESISSLFPVESREEPSLSPT